MKRSRLATYAVGVALAAAMTGCGGDEGSGDGGDGGDFAEQSAADIVDAASEAMGELSSVQVTGDINSDGQAASIDFQTSNEGKCSGTLALGEAGSIELLGVDGDLWFKGDEAFWTGTGIPDVSLVLDKWVVDGEGDFSQFCDIDELISSLFEDDGDKTYETAGTESLDGEDVVVIEQDDAEDGVSTGYVRADEPHHMLRIEKEGEDGGSVVFSEFDEDFEVTAPSEDEIVDLADLQEAPAS